MRESNFIPQDWGGKVLQDNTDNTMRGLVLIPLAIQVVLALGYNGYGSNGYGSNGYGSNRVKNDGGKNGKNYIFGEKW